MRRGGTRTFHLTASQFTQQIANFPIKKVQVWGYNRSTPGPTLIAYRGERIRVVVTNRLPETTTVHFHGAGAPNRFDGVAGISQPDPIPVGKSFTYSFVVRRAGTFAYHSHTRSAVQELRGPRRLPARDPAPRPRPRQGGRGLRDGTPAVRAAGGGWARGPVPARHG